MARTCFRCRCHLFRRCLYAKIARTGEHSNLHCLQKNHSQATPMPMPSDGWANHRHSKTRAVLRGESKCCSCCWCICCCCRDGCCCYCCSRCYLFTFNCATTTKRNAQNTNLDAARNPKHTSEQYNGNRDSGEGDALCLLRTVLW